MEAARDCQHPSRRGSEAYANQSEQLNASADHQACSTPALSSAPVSKKWQLSLLNHASIFKERLTPLLEQEGHASVTYQVATRVLHCLPAVDEVTIWSNERCCGYCEKGQPLWSSIAPIVEVLTLVIKRTSQELWEDLLGNHFKRHALMTAEELQNCSATEEIWPDLGGLFLVNPSMGKGLLRGIRSAVENVQDAAVKALAEQQ